MVMKYIVKLMLCFLCVLTLTGCRQKEESSETGKYIYYVDITATDLVKVSYDGDTVYGTKEVEAMLIALDNPNDMDDCQSPLPKEVEVMSYRLIDDRLTLYFDQSYYKMDNVREVLLRSAMVQSLTQIEGINWIGFNVNDAPLVDSNNKEYGWMRGEDFVQNTGSSINSYQKTSLTLYFANESGDKLMAEARTIRYNSNMALEKVIVDQVLKGPVEEGHYPTIASEAKVLGVSVKDDICYVNFDEGVQTNSYNLVPEAALYSIVNSLIQNGTVEQVQISVNGETTVKFQGVISLEKPLSVNEKLITEQ